MTSLKARLTKAKAQLLGTAARDIPVPFELPCDCGHRVSGIRRPTFQVAVCSACHSEIYVLPTNVYPATRRIHSEVVDGPASARLGSILRDLLKGEDKPAPADSRPKIRVSSQNTGESTGMAAVSDDATPETKDHEQTGPRRRAKTRRSRVPTDDRPNEKVLDHSETGTPLVLLPRLSLAVRLKKLFSPTRLLALAGVGILMTTGWWMIRQQQREAARKIWRQEMDQVAVAFQENDLDSLQSALTKAVDAATVLNRSDAESREAESLLHQTEAVRNLSAADLVSLLSEPGQGEGAFNAGKATEICKSLIGQQLVFEAMLRIKSGSQSIPELDMPLMINGVPLRISVPSLSLRKCAEASPEIPLLFVAPISTCQPPTGYRHEWRMSLDATASTLITTEFHAKVIGYDVAHTPGLDRILQKQAGFVKSSMLSSVDSPSLDKQGDQP